MEKQVLSTAFAVTTCLLLFAACGNDDNGNETTLPVAVTGVTFSPASTAMAVGDTLMLVPTVLPSDAANKAVSWSSSSTTVATVDNNGKVIAAAFGTAVITATAQDGSGQTGACTVTVDWLGAVSFASSQTWKVGDHTWSDAVQATGCNKTVFDGGDPNVGFKADGRSNPGYKGSLFSWEAVNQYKTRLCPDGWRVPTMADFVTLDKALGGTGNGQPNTTLRDKYLNSWGGQYGGGAYSGSLYAQGSGAYYWSQSENSSTSGYNLYFGTSGYVSPQNNDSKHYGFTLRCVK